MEFLGDGHEVALESVLTPHTRGPPQRRHARHDEGFYVLSGTIRFTVGDEDHDAGPGTFANPTGRPAVMLGTFTPDLYVQYFRDLRDVLDEGRRPLTPQANVDAMSRYATEPAADFT
ncbi:cupin domain-containing protein [Streptomyces goshikiensis]|uniref:cupin domain-containing protein n=1 Tax=Streptomyces goshikiensis TaxID=1942 RepID=UPI00368C724D